MERVVEVLDCSVVIVPGVRREARGLEKADDWCSERERHRGSHPQPKQRVVGRMPWNIVNIHQSASSKTYSGAL